MSNVVQEELKDSKLRHAEYGSVAKFEKTSTCLQNTVVV